jgi:hypothetical protein
MAIVTLPEGDSRVARRGAAPAAPASLGNDVSGERELPLARQPLPILLLHWRMTRDGPTSAWERTVATGEQTRLDGLPAR